MFVYENIFNTYDDLSRIESMDYDTTIFKIPALYKEAANLLFTKHDWRYSELGGPDELKKTIADYEEYLTKVPSKKAMIFVGGGVSSLIGPIVEAILNLPENSTRKKVLLFSPDYTLFHSAVEYAGGKPVMIKAERHNDFITTIEKISKNISKETAAILFSNPNNPSGKNYPVAWIKELIKLAKKHNIFIISDEIYSEMLYDLKSFTHIAKIQNSYHNYVKLFGLSKDRPGMTGMRTGYCIGDKRLNTALYDIQMVRNFSTSALADAILNIDMALRYQALSNKKSKVLKIFSEKDIQAYYKTINDNKNKQQKYLKIVIDELKNNKHITDIIMPDGGNCVFFKYYKNMAADKLAHEFAKKGLAIYPCDAFNMDPLIDGSWTRICVTQKIDFLKKLVKTI